MIATHKTMILKSRGPKDGDSPTVREIKDAVRENLQNRYADPEFWDFLRNAQHLISLRHVDSARPLENLWPPQRLRLAEDIVSQQIYHHSRRCGQTHCLDEKKNTKRVNNLKLENNLGWFWMLKAEIAQLALMLIKCNY